MEKHFELKFWEYDRLGRQKRIIKKVFFVSIIIVHLLIKLVFVPVAV